MFLYALAKQIYNVFFPIHRPFCRICGRVKEEYFVDEATWQAITGRPDPPPLDSLCFRHFDALARMRGVRGTWQITRRPEWPESEI